MRDFGKGFWVTAAASIMLLVAASGAMGCPKLQLDIGGGHYVKDTTAANPDGESIVAGASKFNLYAYMYGLNINSNYYISAAILPNPGMASDDLGFFTINGKTINVTKDMFYGVPPLESNLAFDSHDLGPHGVFPTWFSETPFKFDTTDLSKLYNTQDATGSGPQIYNPKDSKMYYVPFDVDLTGLNPDLVVHFDLYDEIIVKCRGVVTDIDRDNFAPFSHDANGSSPPRTLVPEPASMMLLTTGLVGLAVMRRRQRRK
ncbi:MAG TPA: choice-of-anchor N protein [Candidatus Deferrimicrobiaceae bacterium]|jgi:hypothetical protein